ncbi:methyl-accepting chemotaxis protein [Alteromonas sp. D210916BOD_24]|uniref:methyl-accepting chemotaxis protein n=1 Tax=Alteromonas sp. D210916BOD_24 TaxID=3157618 RepID=UPI00399D38D6
MLSKKLTIVQLTLLVTGALFLSLAFLAFKNIGQLTSFIHQAEQDKRVVSLVSAVERVAHHHALERGLTAGFLGNPSDEAKQKVVNQRENADTAFKELAALAQQTWPEELEVESILKPLFDLGGGKSKIRNEVDALQGAGAFSFYSRLNQRALSAANAFTLLVYDQSAKKRLAQGLMFAQLKEKLGQRRGKINAVLARQHIAPNVRDEITSYSNEINDLYEKLNLSLANDKQIRFEPFLSSSESLQVERIGALVIAEPVDFSVLPANTEWFGLATAQIGQVATFLKTVFNNVKEITDDTASAARTSLIVIIVVIVLVTIFIALVYRALLSVITRQLNALVFNLNKIAKEGDLTVKVKMDADNELGEISRSVNTTIIALRDLIKGLGESITTSARLSDQLEQSSTNILQDAGNTQNLTTNIASAVEQIAVTSREIAQSSLDTLNASKSLDELAEQSLIANDRIKHSMSSLSEDIKGVQSNAKQMETKVMEIGSILETINTLSDQTNLLALNAAIEAARAGEHGRGFAVVADEVRKLAKSSRESSDKISTLLLSLREASVVVVNDINKNVESISTSMDTTEDGRNTVAKVKEAATELELMANNMSSAAEQQSMTTEAVAKDVVAVEEAARHELGIAQALSQLSKDMQHNNRLLLRTVEGFKVD